MAAPLSDAFTIGVEEEYQIIDPSTRALSQSSTRILPEAHAGLGDAAAPELYQSQIEMATPVCTTFDDVRDQVAHARHRMIEAARKENKQIAAASTHPFSHWSEQDVTPKDRYKGLSGTFQQLARELVIFGCHVHVGIDDREIAIGVMNRTRIWLAPLLALTANSPFWLGTDSGYASYRTELWNPFPMAGPPLVFASRAEHDALIASLVQTGSIEDETNIYWDMRMPAKVKTLEFRATDVCLTIDETVMVALLCRALVEVCFESYVHDEPFAAVRPELLRAAHWRAARHGLDDELIDVVAERSVPARELIETLLAFGKPALERRGEWEFVSRTVHNVLSEGNGATRQRRVFRETGTLEAVVDFIVEQSAQGAMPITDSPGD